MGNGNDFLPFDSTWKQQPWSGLWLIFKIRSFVHSFNLYPILPPTNSNHGTHFSPSPLYPDNNAELRQAESDFHSSMSECSWMSQIPIHYTASALLKQWPQFSNHKLSTSLLHAGNRNIHNSYNVLEDSVSILLGLYITCDARREPAALPVDLWLCCHALRHCTLWYWCGMAPVQFIYNQAAGLTNHFTQSPCNEAQVEMPSALKWMLCWNQ